METTYSEELVTQTFAFIPQQTITPLAYTFRIGETYIRGWHESFILFPPIHLFLFISSWLKSSNENGNWNQTNFESL